VPQYRRKPVAYEPPDKDDQYVAEFTCRVVMDFKIRVRAITPESVADEFTPSDDLTWEWAERQGRLLRALLDDEETLNQYLVSTARGDLAYLLESDQIEVLPPDEEDDLFERVYQKLGEEDARFFREVREEGLLYDNTKLVHLSFVADWASAQLEELRLVGRGKPSKTEAQ
jgi:hypothetical protein